MEGKKISFGFMKTKKAEKPIIEEKRDYIECLEEKSIKVVGGEIIQEDIPLVIPMKPNTLITAERLQEIAEKVEKSLEEPENIKQEENDEKEVKPAENETLEQMAVRELMQEAKEQVKVEGGTILTVPVPAKPVMDGQKESTLEDYEAVPVQDFGMAMLRGMGWTPGKDQSSYKLPQVRPKGLGLGADKVVSENQKKKSSKEKDDELTIVKNSFVKITTGKYSGCYGKVVSLDEDNGRVMVEIPVKKDTVSLSEFMMQPVTKAEYDKESKVINADTFEQYKKSENGQRSRPNDPPKVERDASSSKNSNDLNKDKERRDKREDSYRKEEVDSSNVKSRDKSNRNRNDSSSSEDRSRPRRKEKKKHKSRDSSSSLSDTERRRKHKSSKKRQSSSEDSNSQKKDRKYKSSEGKRDIDKKRKGKKKKRDRDRSPNYKKHRK